AIAARSFLVHHLGYILKSFLWRIRMPRKLLVLAAMIALTPLLAVSQDDASADNANAARAYEPAPATANSPIAAAFFAIDVAGKYCCSTTDLGPGREW